MEEENRTIQDAVSEIKMADETQLKTVIEKWFESTRNQGLKLGAKLVSSVVMETINKNLKKGSQSSLRDYKRAIKIIVETISVPLKQDNIVQNDSEISEG